MKHYALMIVFAASATSALAQTRVELYGRLDVSVNHYRYNSTPATGSDSDTAVSSDVSMIGFRGREDLGDGLRAYFKMEHGLQMDTGFPTNATQFWNRESYVGLGHTTYGSVQLGSMYYPGVYATVRVDPFARFTSASMLYLLQGLGGTRGFPSIINNTVAYVSPIIAGASGKVFVSKGEGAATGSSYAGSLEYDRSPIYATLTYNHVKLLAPAVGLTGDPVQTTAWTFGATYDLTVVKLHGWYQRDKADQLPNSHGYMAGVSMPLGPGVVRASYTHRSTPNADASLVGVGYDYNLSKRSLVYTVLAKVSNSGTAAYPIGPSSGEQRSAGLPAPGRDAVLLQVGIRHFF